MAKRDKQYRFLRLDILDENSNTTRRRLYSYNRKTNTYDPVLDTDSLNGVPLAGIFKAILIVLLISALFTSLTGRPDTNFTFSALLNKLNDAPSLFPDEVLRGFKNFHIYNDWGSFGNFFRDLINMFADTLSIIVFLSIGLVQLLIYVIWILGIFFGW